MEISRKKLAYMGMMAATAIWGLNFVVIKLAVAQYPLLSFLFLRFAIGGVVLCVLALTHPRWREGWRQAPKLKLVGLSGIVAVGYTASALGISYGVSPGLAAMINAMVLVITPSLDWLISGRRPDARFMAVLLLAGAAVALTAIGAPTSHHSNLSLGISLEVVAVVAFSMQIIILERLSRSVDLMALAGGQLITLAGIFGLATAITGSWVTPGVSMWPLLLFSGLGASAIGLMIQILAQRHVDSAAVAAITALEPGYAMGFGWLLLQSVVSPLSLFAVVVLVLGSIAETTFGRMLFRLGWSVVTGLTEMNAEMAEIYCRVYGFPKLVESE